jgi:hypothetical protein
MVDGFITTYAISSNPVLGEVYLIQRYVMKWFATRSWFSPGTPVSSTNKTEILLKVVLNTINHNHLLYCQLFALVFGQ